MYDRICTDIVNGDNFTTEIFGILTIYGIYVAFLQFIALQLKDDMCYMGRTYSYIQFIEKKSFQIALKKGLPCSLLLLVLLRIGIVICGESVVTPILYLSIGIIKVVISIFFIILLSSCVISIQKVYILGKVEKETLLWNKAEDSIRRKIRRKIQKSNIKRFFRCNWENGFFILFDELSGVLSEKRNSEYDDRILKFFKNVIGEFNEKLKRVDNSRGIWRALDKSNEFLEKCMLLDNKHRVIDIIVIVKSIQMEILKKYVLTDNRTGKWDDISRYIELNRRIWMNSKDTKMRKRILDNMKRNLKTIKEECSMEDLFDMDENRLDTIRKTYMHDIFQMLINDENLEDIIEMFATVLDSKAELLKYFFVNMYEYIRVYSMEHLENFKRIICEIIDDEEKIYLLLYVFIQSRRESSMKCFEYIKIDLFYDIFWNIDFMEYLKKDSKHIEKILKRSGMNYYINADKIQELAEDLQHPISVNTFVKYRERNFGPGLFIALKAILSPGEIGWEKIDVEDEKYIYLRMELLSFFKENPQMLDNSYVKRLWERICEDTFWNSEKIDILLKTDFEALVLVQMKISKELICILMEETVVSPAIIKYLITYYGQELESILDKEQMIRIKNSMRYIFRDSISIEETVDQMMDCYETYRNPMCIRNKNMICEWIKKMIR